MPKVRSLSDFNRNQAAFIEEIGCTREPLYLTRNGRSSVVVMDSDAFDELISFRNDLRAKEMRVYEGLIKGYDSFMLGNTVLAEEADVRIRKSKGWD